LTAFEESLLQSFLCENCQRQSCKACLTVHKWFLPRCMECRRGLAMRIRPSVRQSVRLSVKCLNC